MCLDCLDNVLILKRNCPFCRTEVPEDFAPALDESKQAEIRARRPEAFTKKLQEITQQRLQTDTITVLYGNTHKMIENPGTHNSHDWTVFVKLANSKLDIGTYINKVVFKLHPTFPDPVYELYNEPFQVQCEGWGVFEIPIKIYWKSWLEKQPTKLNHMLSFDGNGDRNTVVVKFKKSIYRTMEEERDSDEGEALYE